MKNAVKSFTYLTLAFLMLHALSALFSGTVAVVIKILAVALPVGVGYAASHRLKTEREQISGLAEKSSELYKIKPAHLGATALLAAPVIALIFLISYLTSLLLSALGLSASAVENEPLLKMLAEHAFIPAILEEMMFRYLPMKLLAPYSKKWCAIISALYFSLIHMNLFQLPYALAAGLIFIVIDLATESVLPSLILHFLNNAVSVLFIKYSPDPGFVLPFVIVMVALALISLIPIVIKRKGYLSAIGSTLGGRDRLEERTSVMIFVFFLAAMMAANLFA